MWIERGNQIHAYFRILDMLDVFIFDRFYKNLIRYLYLNESHHLQKKRAFCSQFHTCLLLGIFTSECLELSCGGMKLSIFIGNSITWNVIRLALETDEFLMFLCILLNKCCIHNSTWEEHRTWTKLMVVKIGNDSETDSDNTTCNGCVCEHIVYFSSVC